MSDDCARLIEVAFSLKQANAEWYASKELE